MSSDKITHNVESREDSVSGSESRQSPPSASTSRITLQQWLSAFSTAAVLMNTSGLVVTFGTFQTYYEESLLADISSSNISWISTTVVFLALAGGVVAGPIYDHGHYRLLLISGTVLEIFGLMMLSLSTVYYQVFLSQGLCVGVGMGLMYVPSIAQTMSIFDTKRRARCMAFMSAAIGVAGVIYPIVFRQILNQAGFAWAVRSVAFVALGLFTPVYVHLFHHQVQTTGTARAWIDGKAFTDWPFMFALLMNFFSCLSFFVPVDFLPLFAETGVRDFVDQDLAFYLIAIMNGTSAVGRVMIGFVAQRLGPTETLALGCLSSTVVLFCWPAVRSTAGLIAFVVVWGLTSSVVVALPGAVVPLLTPDMKMLGTRNGMFWFCVALGALIGPPIGGALLSPSGSSAPQWWHLQLFTALGMLMAVLSAVPIIMHLRRRKF